MNRFERTGPDSVFSQLLLATAVVATAVVGANHHLFAVSEDGGSSWHNYHQQYMRRFAVLVVPIMLFEAALAGFGLLALGDRTLPVVRFLPFFWLHRPDTGAASPET